MLLKEFIKEGTETISSLYPEREAREMVLAYLEHRLGTTRHTHIIDPAYVVPDSSLEEIRSSFFRMASGEPLQYVTGKAYFYDRVFRVSPDVLIPRPETEILCRTVIDDLSRRGIKTPRILDLCTGSGCIAWTLALEIPGAEVVAVDISDGALSIASGQNFSEEISREGASFPHFVKADVLKEPLADLGQFDVIVSNPPYVMDSEKALMRANVLDHEPHLALFVPDYDPLLFYRAVAGWCIRLLRPGGSAVVEINEALASETEEVFLSCGFTDVRTIKDLNDKDRFVSFIKEL